MEKFLNFEIYARPKHSKNYIATIAIGEKYYNEWREAALPLWERYCQYHDLGIIVFTGDLIMPEDESWKKATWQKLLIGEVLRANDVDAQNICYIDTDILINPFAPNVFENYNEETIGLVSLRKNLPQPREETLRRLAFLRHTYYDRAYPLDSALFISLEKIYEHHSLAPQDDFFCAGFFLFNLKNHTDRMAAWFRKYPKNTDSITGGGDQTHLNYEFLNWGNVSWLDYRFQAIWTYEISWKYPFLYSYGKNNVELIRECIEASLYANYFLHFAGSWHESQMWKIGKFFEGEEKNQVLGDYYNYLKTPVSGEPRGVIKPDLAMTGSRKG